MAEIIRFPKSEYAAMGEKLAALQEEGRQRKLRALELIAKLMGRGKLQDSQLFLMFTDEGTTSYINLGYGMDELVKVVDIVLDHAKEHPQDWDF